MHSGLPGRSCKYLLLQWDFRPKFFSLFQILFILNLDWQWLKKSKFSTYKIWKSEKKLGSKVHCALQQVKVKQQLSIVKIGVFENEYYLFTFDLIHWGNLIFEAPVVQMCLIFMGYFEHFYSIYGKMCKFSNQSYTWFMYICTNLNARLKPT